MIIVSGGTSYVGRELVAMLRLAGLPFKVLTRDRTKTRENLGRDVSCVSGDMNKPATLKAAFGGADRLFLIAQSGPSYVAHIREAVHIARLSGINHIVMMSGPDILLPAEVKSQLGNQCWEAEEELIRSGTDYTILRPTYFMQNVLIDQSDLVKSKRLMRGAILPNAPIAMVDARDVAGVAYAALAYGGHRGKTYSLTGTPTTYQHVAMALSEALQQSVRYDQIKAGKGNKTTLRGKPTKWHLNLERDWANVFAAGGGDFTTSSIVELTGYQPRTIEEFINDHITLFT
ncbi:MAG: NAD(P)H-binding protein [Alphaproteobacteria bacterium]